MLDQTKLYWAPANIIFEPLQQKISPNHNHNYPNHNSPSTEKLAQITTTKKIIQFSSNQKIKTKT
jgi:hypothetical protein